MLEDQNLRNDIKMGEVALTLAVQSFGRDGAPNGDAVVHRAKVLYAWLRNENKR